MLKCPGLAVFGGSVARRLGRSGLITTAIALALMLGANGTALAEASSPPDLVLIMADDLGFADLGCYGSEIDTPNLDRLAQQGVRFSQFRVAPMCVVSRVALLSGQPFNGGGDAQYTQSVPFPKLLNDAGYFTAMAGKWHAGNADPKSPEMFNRFFGFMGGMTDSFAGGPDWFLGQEKFTNFGPDFYATKDLTDHAIESLHAAREAEKPAFVFLSFNAPHHPCQAPQATVEKYADRYLAGYQEIHAARVQRQRDLGLIPADLEPAMPGGEVRRWYELPEHRKQVEAGRMAAYAATVDEIDQHVGRLLAAIEAGGRAENTLVIFISDNGGDYGNGGRLIDETQIPWAVGGNPSSSNGWAWVKNTPFRSYKHASFEGALASPLIMRWPAGLDVTPGSILHDPAHITDLYPTLLAVAGVEQPSRYDGKTIAPPAGASLLPLISESAAEREIKPAFAWYDHSRAWIEDGWKAVQLYDGPWQLYNLNEDRSEQHDLAAEHTDKLKAMVRQWTAQAAPPARGHPEFPPADTFQQGWGWHRVNRAARNHLVALTPANGVIDADLDIDLRLVFDAPLDFTDSGSRGIRLFKVADESAPIWSASLAPQHPAQGQKELVFDDLPLLEPDTGYFVEWDPAWVKIGGEPAGPLNDGAYWWRFRTAVIPE